MIWSKSKAAIRSFVTLLCLGAWYVTPAFSSIWPATPLEELVKKSDLIVVGVYRSSYSFLHDLVPWDAYERGRGTIEKDRFLTRNLIEISEVIKGDYKECEIGVAMFGGTIGDMREADSFSFHLEKDDRVLIFLKWDEWNHMWFSVGQAASVFIVTQADDSEALEPAGEVGVA